MFWLGKVYLPCMLILLLAIICGLFLVSTYGKGRGIAQYPDVHRYVSCHMAAGNGTLRYLHPRKLPDDDNAYYKRES